jgi:nucleotide-binding universal stress UspA family protein
MIMGPIHRILVPVALSPACAWAAKYACQVASKFGAELLFLHARERSTDDTTAFVEKAVGSGARVLIVDGDPAQGIIQAANEKAIDLIIMPTHAHGPLRRLLLGSVTAKVLHDAECPVWTGVHSEDRPFEIPSKFTQVICAVEMDKSCIRLIRSAIEFAGALGAELKIVHAIPAADETSDNRGEIEVRHFLFRLAKTSFDGLLGRAELNVTISLVGGPVATVVREAALREHAELVIIGRGQTRGGLGRLGTHAYGIIRHSPCPVLSI